MSDVPGEVFALTRAIRQQNAYTNVMSQFLRLARDESRKTLAGKLDVDIAKMSSPEWLDDVSNTVANTYDRLANGEYYGKNVFGRPIEEAQVNLMLQQVAKDYASGVNKVISSFDVIDKRSVSFLQDYNFNLIQRISDDTRLGIKGATMKGVGIGENPAQLKNRILNWIDEPFPVYRKVDLKMVENGLKTMDEIKPIRVIQPSTRANMIGRTERSRAYNLGNLNDYRERGVRKIDVPHHEGECPLCDDEIETNFPADIDYEDIPPWHPYCTHNIIPVADIKGALEDLEALGVDFRFEDTTFQQNVGVPPYNEKSGMTFATSNLKELFEATWASTEINQIKHLITLLPDHLKLQDILKDGILIVTDKLSVRIDNLEYHLNEDSIEKDFLTFYSDPYYARYQLFGLMKDYDRLTFRDAFCKYILKEQLPNKLQDFFDTEVFRVS